jgi:hypothetical protein
MIDFDRLQSPARFFLPPRLGCSKGHGRYLGGPRHLHCRLPGREEKPSTRNYSRDPSTCRLLTSIQNCVHFRHIRFVVDHATIHLDPRMRLEWQLLCPDYHLGEYPVALEEATRRCRALQTERFLPVPDTSHVDRRTNVFHCVGSRGGLSHGIVANLVVEYREITSSQVEIEANQLQVRFQNKKRHGAHPLLFAIEIGCLEHTVPPFAT